MVHLDHGLIRSARSLINGANVHGGRELIFVYEQAVLLHNEGSPWHVVYNDTYEKELRRFIERESNKRAAFTISCDGNRLAERNKVVMKHARKAIDRGQRVQERCQDLDVRVNNVLSLSKEDELVLCHLMRRRQSGVVLL